MKKILALLFVLALPLFAADHFWCGVITTKQPTTYNQIYVAETASQVILTYNEPLSTGDATGSWHSKPIYIADCNESDAYVWAVTNAASDINILWKVSADGVNWSSSTPAGLDACSTTVKSDTLGIEVGTDWTNFHHANYLIIEADNQTGTDATDYVSITIAFNKDIDPASGTTWPKLAWVQSSRSPSEANWTNP